MRCTMDSACGAHLFETKEHMKKKPVELPQTITVKRNEFEPESMELVAASVIRIADALDHLKKAGSDRLICLILNDVTGGATGVSKRDIKTILDAVPRIRSVYFKRKS